jgi:hypothetical protein
MSTPQATGVNNLKTPEKGKKFTKNARASFPKRKLCASS